jgi:hypothetical protein
MRFLLDLFKRVREYVLRLLGLVGPVLNELYCARKNEGLHAGIVEECADLLIQQLVRLVYLGHETKMEAIAGEDIVSLSGPRYKFVFDYGHVQILNSSNHLSKELVEKLLELTRARSNLDNIVSVVRILLDHGLLHVLDQLVDWRLLREIECPECALTKVVDELLEVTMESRIKVKAASVVLKKRKGHNKVKHAFESGPLCVELSISHCKGVIPWRILRNAPMEFFKSPALDRDNVQSAQSTVNRLLPVALLFSHDLENVVVRVDDAGHPFGDVFRVHVLEVELDMSLQVEELLVYIARKQGYIELIDRKHGRTKHLRILELTPRYELVRRNRARNDTGEQGFTGPSVPVK